MNRYFMLCIRAFFLLIAFILTYFVSRRRKMLPRDLSPIKARAQADNQIIAILPRQEMRADLWLYADFNHWGVFAETEQNTIVVFDHQGRAILEFCPPKQFRTFTVDEDEIHLVYYSGEKAAFPFSTIPINFLSTPFTPPAPKGDGVQSVRCYGRKLRVCYNNPQVRPKNFHYFSALPQWFFDRLDPLWYFFVIVGPLLGLIS